MDSKSSSEETDRSDELPVTGSGRSYECVFCKRGFTTAQALGGHMNIHRKDRVKSRSPTIVSSPKMDDNNYHHHPHVSNQPFFVASGWGGRSPHMNKDSHHLINNPFGGVGLKNIGSSHLHDENKKTDESSQEDDDGLDLELRLGHDP